jgi:pimeloyl-ACP methyl ester carboxylesterase
MQHRIAAVKPIQKPKRPEVQRSAFLVALLIAVAVLVTGCASRIAANRIIAAPNLYGDREVKDWTEAWTKSLEKLSGGTNPFTPLRVAVGPPSAELAALQLLPRDCCAEVFAEIKGIGDGRTNLLISLQPLTNKCSILERGCIVLLHGYRVRKEFMTPWAFVLANAGYRVILVDLRGHGESTGKIFSGGKYETADLVQLLDELTAKGICENHVGVLGYSFGADLALNWAARDPRVSAVVAIAPYDQPTEAFLRLAEITKLPLGRHTLQNGMALAGTKLGVRWTEWSGTAALRRMSIPALLVGGGRDAVSLPADLTALQRVGPRGTECVMIPEADHVSVGYAFPRLREPVISWFNRHLSSMQLAR